MFAAGGACDKEAAACYITAGRGRCTSEIKNGRGLMIECLALFAAYIRVVLGRNNRHHATYALLEFPTNVARRNCCSDCLDGAGIVGLSNFRAGGFIRVCGIISYAFFILLSFQEILFFFLNTRRQ